MRYYFMEEGSGGGRKVGEPAIPIESPSSHPLQ
jgi:hypothetical protein